MGMITIQTTGSFGRTDKVFTASEHGHAHCINEAQEYLTELMREAVNADHHLHEDGAKPNKGFHKIKGE